MPSKGQAAILGSAELVSAILREADNAAAVGRQGGRGQRAGSKLLGRLTAEAVRQRAQDLSCRQLAAILCAVTVGVDGSPSRINDSLLDDAAALFVRSAASEDASSTEDSGGGRGWPCLPDLAQTMRALAMRGAEGKGRCRYQAAVEVFGKIFAAEATAEADTEKTVPAAHLVVATRAYCTAGCWDPAVLQALEPLLVAASPELNAGAVAAMLRSFHRARRFDRSSLDSPELLDALADRAAAVADGFEASDLAVTLRIYVDSGRASSGRGAGGVLTALSAAAAATASTLPVSQLAGIAHSLAMGQRQCSFVKGEAFFDAALARLQALPPTELAPPAAAAALLRAFVAWGYVSPISENGEDQLCALLEPQVLQLLWSPSCRDGQLLGALWAAARCQPVSPSLLAATTDGLLAHLDHLAPSDLSLAAQALFPLGPQCPPKLQHALVDALHRETAAMAPKHLASALHALPAILGLSASSMPSAQDRVRPLADRALELCQLGELPPEDSATVMSTYLATAASLPAIFRQEEAEAKKSGPSSSR